MNSSNYSRRIFLERSLAASTAWSLGTVRLPAASGLEGGSGNLHLAPFRFDVTPPTGHSLCGGWIKPVVAVDDPLWAIGFVLIGAGKPRHLAVLAERLCSIYFIMRLCYTISQRLQTRARTPRETNLPAQFSAA